MIRTVFYVGSLAVISFFLYNQYLDFRYYIDTPIIQTNYLSDKDVEIAIRYHGLKYSPICIEQAGKKYYIFIRDGKVYDLFDFRNFPKLKEKLNEK